MISVLIKVNVTVNNMEEVDEIAHDLQEILNDSWITNSVEVTDEISY